MTQLEKELQDVSNVAIAGHIHPDGDSVGSCIGLWQYLRDNYPQIKADIWLEQPDNKFSIIEGYEELKQPDGQDRTYDLFISVDCAALWIVWVMHCRIFRRQSVLSAWIIM